MEAAQRWLEALHASMASDTAVLAGLHDYFRHKPDNLTVRALPAYRKPPTLAAQKLTPRACCMQVPIMNQSQELINRVFRHRSGGASGSLPPEEEAEETVATMPLDARIRLAQMSHYLYSRVLHFVLAQRFPITTAPADERFKVGPLQAV